MKRIAVAAGVGGVAFGVLNVAALVVGNPPTGKYDDSAATAYVASGHMGAFIAAFYLGLLSVFGLICLLAYLRHAHTTAGGDQRLGTIFWGAGLASAAVLAAGYGLSADPPNAASLGATVTPSSTYLFAEAGALFVAGGGVLLALALITFALGAHSTLPAWLRWTTLTLGVMGLASATLAFFALPLWGVITGAWLLTQATGERATSA